MIYRGSFSTRNSIRCFLAIILAAGLPLVGFCAETPGFIYTVAGTGTGGYNGDSIIATTAQINLPVGVFVDNVRNIFIADLNNNRIRKVDAGTGIISTVAGGGGGGDGGLATAASLSNPQGVFVDVSGTIYIADLGNQRIRKVEATTGFITTVAGTGTGGYNGDGITATIAQLNGPCGVFVDSAGNIYIADSSNQRIRKVDSITGLISTVAGTGTAGYLLAEDGGLATAARLNSPTGVFVDSSGKIYIADNNNQRIRMVNLSGLIATVAGGGVGGDGGMATSAQLTNPGSVFADDSGIIYIATNGSDPRIRKVAAGTGLISTVAGTGVQGYNGDDILATTAQINGPGGVAVDTLGNIYISEMTSHRIRKVVAGTISSPTAPDSDKGKIIIHGNVLDVTAGGRAKIFAKGDANKTIKLAVYNRAGKRVAEVPPITLDSTGAGFVWFDGKDSSGKQLLAGIYLVVGPDGQKAQIVIKRGVK